MIGSQIKKYRQEHGISIERLAKALEITPSSLSLIERGESKPSAELIKTFNRLTGLNLGAETPSRRKAALSLSDLIDQYDCLSDREQKDFILHILARSVAEVHRK